MTDKTRDELKKKPNAKAQKDFDRAANVDTDESGFLILDDGVGATSNAPLTGSGNTDEAARKIKR